MTNTSDILSLEPFAKRYLDESLLGKVDTLRLILGKQAALDNQKTMEQFLTPAPVAELMAGLFQNLNLPEITLLDAGAGIGSLLAAVVQRICLLKKRPRKMGVVAYEIDSQLLPWLESTLKHCRDACEFADVSFEYEICNRDFIEDVAKSITPDLWNSRLCNSFSHVVLNPPYSKISSASNTRQFLRQIGLETTNIYTGFMAAAALLLVPNGEMVTITPRSFCNGTYFRSFREFFLSLMNLCQLHTFESRSNIFSNDSVLQETIILHCNKQDKKADSILITTSAGVDDDMELWHRLPYSEVVRPDDEEKFIRVLSDPYSRMISSQMEKFTCSLEELGISVSTGRVVDFRAKEYLRTMPGKNTVPLIYPSNFIGDRIMHPVQGKKPQALIDTLETEKLLVPEGNYVLCKRFSTKEEKRRIVAAVYQAQTFSYTKVGFENHVNYFHQNGLGLDLDLARGLSIFLNSSLVDSFFRLFNGHTQVNVSDLRSLKYPAKESLVFMGNKFGDKKLTQKEVDDLLEENLLGMSGKNEENPLKVKSRIKEALDILMQLGLPRQQLNERSALTLLALLDIKPSLAWKDARARSIGVTPMMDFMAEHYGKTYKPNTRETVRRQTVHQFLDAALIIINPDAPDRPVNSPKTVYQIEESVLNLIRQYDTQEWHKALRSYLASAQTLKQKYAQEREMARIPIVIDGELIKLSPGGQNVLIQKIIDQFADRFTPHGELLYVGDTDEKFAYFKKDPLKDLGVIVDSHGKMPDVIIHFRENDWLILIEAVTSHGPINPKRKQELERLFEGATIPLVMVTTFLSRQAMLAYLPEIAWETDVWVAEDATHLIHFNGQHLLQLYSPNKA